MHDSRTVANYLLKLAKESGQSLTPMQLLKLVYIAHGWSLGLYGRPLIKDEIQAWQYGPVIPNLYKAVRDYKGQQISGSLQSPSNDDLTEIERGLLKQVFDLYGSKSGPALSRLTHSKGTPWASVYEPGSFGIPIPDDIIEDHYQRLSAERRR
jgi:uncharacterized phage-associated protein